MTRRRAYPSVVGVGEGVEEIAVLANGASHHDLTGAGQDLQLAHGLVGQPASKGAGLDAQSGHRATDRDGLQLRHDQRHQAVGQRRVPSRS